MENTQIQIFKNEELGLNARTLVDKDGNILVNVEDTILGFGFIKVDRKNNKEYIRLDIPRVQKYINETSFGNLFPKIKKDDFIPESLFYILGMKASNKVAQKFQQWLAVDVIPSIRKHGAYMTENVIEEILTNPDTIIKLATTLKEEKQKRKLAEQQLEEAKPKINFAEKIEFTKASISMKKFADLMNIKNFGRNKLLQWLRNKEYLNKSNQPYRQYIERDLFEIKERVVDLGFKGEKIQTTTYVTGKGQTYLYNKIMQDINIRA